MFWWWQTAPPTWQIAALRQRAARSPARFRLLVPAVPRGLAWATDMKAGEDDTTARAEDSLGRLRLAGLDMEGAMVGDPDRSPPSETLCTAANSKM